MIEQKPRLEVNKEYKLGQCNGIYLGHIAESNIDMHVFSISGRERKLYVLYDDKWICESEERVISHNPYAPTLPKIFHEKDITQENSNLSKLIKSLEEKKIGRASCRERV